MLRKGGGAGLFQIGITPIGGFYLTDLMARSIVYLLELNAYDTGLASVVTKRYGSIGYNNRTSPGYYDPRLTQALKFRRDMWGNNRVGGAGTVSYGEIQMANDDGGLDDLRDFGTAGQALSFYIGDPNGEYPDDFISLFRGSMEQILLDTTRATIRVKDRLQDLNKPIQQNKYAGTNSLPNGLEGTADLKGKEKPLLFGWVNNISPPCVNTSRLIYQVNDGVINGVYDVYDAGAALTKGSNYTSQSDMETNAPAASTYREWPAGGYFRLGSNPVGTITCDALGDTTPAVPQSAALVAWKIVLHLPGGLPAADVSATDVTILDIANSDPVGIWINDSTTFLSALDAVLSSVGAWYGFDRFGVFRMKRLGSPSSPSLTLRRGSIDNSLSSDELDILDFRMLQTNDPDRGVLTWQVTANYSKNYTVQSGDGLAGSVTPARRAYLAEAVRSEVANDPSVKIGNPGAIEKTIDTLFSDPVNGFAHAAAEASRVLGLFKMRRDFVEIDIPLLSSTIKLIDLGTVVTVSVPRFGYGGSGRVMTVIGMEYNTTVNRLTLSLWG